MVSFYTLKHTALGLVQQRMNSDQSSKVPHNVFLVVCSDAVLFFQLDQRPTPAHGGCNS